MKQTITQSDLARTFLAKNPPKNPNYWTLYEFLFLLSFSFFYNNFILAYIFLNLQNIHSITQLVFQILLSSLFKTQGLCLGVTVKPPKMNLSVCCFYGCLRILLQVKESRILIGL